MPLTARKIASRTALVTALASVAIGAPAAQAGPIASASANCRGADAQPGSVSATTFRASTLCLVNRERSARGMRKLRTNKRLGRAARGHAEDMVRRTYFAHDSLSGKTFIDRIEHAGYMRRAHSWTVGENLAWGTGHEATPRQIAIAWMHSPEHRANILKRRYREIGIGIVEAAPQHGAGHGATYATDFGSRH